MGGAVYHSQVLYSLQEKRKTESYYQEKRQAHWEGVIRDGIQSGELGHKDGWIS